MNSHNLALPSVGFSCGLCCGILDLCLMKTKWFQSALQLKDLRLLFVCSLVEEVEKNKYSNGCPRDDVVP